MASTYPSVVATLTNPNATDKLNSPSHSSIHGAVNTEVVQLETFIGTTSSAIGTLMYDIRAATSNGGGHVQTANKGGTGQTSFTKGDLLVATSSSVLAKLAVSSVSGQVLTVDTTQAAGVKWGNAVASSRIDVQNANVIRAAGATSVLTAYYAGSILGSTLGTANAVRYTVDFPVLNYTGNVSVYGQVSYGNNVINSFSFPANPQSSIVGGLVLEGFIAGNGSVASQITRLKGRITSPVNTFGGGISASESGVQWMDIYNTGTSSVESSANQNLIVQLQVNPVLSFTSVQSGMVIVEKIA